MKIIFTISVLLSGCVLAKNVNTTDTPPRIDPEFIHQPSASYYGDAAHSAHEFGRCVVRVTVTADGKTLGIRGRVNTTKMETSSGYRGYGHLDWGCEKWVSQFHWIPATHNGNAVEASTSVTIDWTDQGGGSPIGVVVGVPMKVYKSRGPIVEPAPVLVRAPSTKVIVAKPTDRRVRIAVRSAGRIDGPQSQVVTGDLIPASSLLTIIFLESPCTLDIDGAQNMHRAWQLAGAYQLGCWYPGRGGGWQFVGQISQMDHNHQDPWETMPRGLLHADGTVTVIEPDYDSRTFASDWFSNRNAHLFDHVHDQP